MIALISFDNTKTHLNKSFIGNDTVKTKKNVWSKANTKKTAKNER